GSEEENKNRFHKEYGLWSNMRYVAKSMFRTEPKLRIIIAVLVISVTATRYLWTFISKFVIDAVTGQQSIKYLIVLMLALVAAQLVFTLAETWAQYDNWYRYISVRFVEIINKNRKFMTQRYQNLEDKDVMDCYQKAGNATNNNNNGVEGMMHVMENFATNLAVVIVGLVIMGTLSVPIVIGMALIAVFNFAVKNHTNKVCKKRIWDPLATWWRKDGYMSYTFTDFSAAKDIRMYGLKDYLIGKYKELSKERLAAQKENELRWWVCGLIGNALWLIAESGLYAWLIYSVIHKDLSIGNFTLYLGSAATFFNNVLAILDRVNDLLARSREVDDFRSFMDIDNDLDEGGKSVPKFDKYEFTFEDVWFKYPGAENYALKHLNLTVKAGEKLAVVGLNGAGKTTFIKLLLRLYEPTQGRILLNGTDISEYNRQEYYRLFSPVFQEVCLFAFPLHLNVSMSTVSDSDKEKAVRCLEDAGMAEKIRELKNGVDTEVLKVVEDDGVDFSGGEKQKIALARALYKNAPVIVLDEPTAALDAIAEARLYQDFDRLVSGRTAIYISHRLSSTQFCTNVAMFKDAEMVEYGTHDSLLKAGGAYSEMFNVQAQYYVENGEEGADKAVPCEA
ncbi:MAG: ABC transporter ATP-binding protein, partial [Lachnospiraceae bacterium]|nr:ABC transporter ATP-binding protein [Lachnospiraceae bacterium]